MKFELKSEQQQKKTNFYYIYVINFFQIKLGQNLKMQTTK